MILRKLLSGVTLIVFLTILVVFLWTDTQMDLTKGSKLEKLGAATLSSSSGGKKKISQATEMTKPVANTSVSLSPAVDVIEIEQALSVLMEQVREKEAIHGGVAALLAKNPVAALAELSHYLTDPSERVRNRTYSMLTLLAIESENQTIRQQAVQYLLEGLGDQSPLVNQHVESDLLNFKREDFSSAAVNTIQELLHLTPTVTIIRLAGIVDLQIESDHIQKIFLKGPSQESLKTGVRYFATPEWAAALAGARLGNKSNLGHVLEKIEGESNNILRVTSLLYDAGYTQRPEAYELIHGYLNSEERLPGTKGIGHQFAQHAVDVLVDELSGFPIEKKYPGGYSEKDILIARQWMAQISNWN